MSRRSQQVIAFVIAILLTIVTWQQVMKWMIPAAPLKYALLTPLLIVVGARDALAVVLSVVQWPLFALGFCAGLQRWKSRVALAVVAVVYIFLAISAFAILRGNNEGIG